MLKFKRDEEIYINGAHIIVTKGKELKIETWSVILRQKYFMTEDDAVISVAHALAFHWFLHHTSKKKMSEEECVKLAEMCVEFFPTLAPIAERKDWFSFYIEMRKLLRS